MDLSSVALRPHGPLSQEEKNAIGIKVPVYNVVVRVM